VTAASSLCACGVFRRTPQLPATLKDNLVDNRGLSKSVDVLDSGYLLVYFSAQWCPSCRAFTPKLVEYYKAHGGGELFDVVFVSSDHSEGKMLAYMRESGMPWPALAYRGKGARTLHAAYCGPGIPCLVLINSSGRVLADSFRGRKYLGPTSVLNRLSELLAVDRSQEEKHEIEIPVAGRLPDSIAIAPAIRKKEKPKQVVLKLVPAPQRMIDEYKIMGFGQSLDGSRTAYINDSTYAVGEELEPGMEIIDITDAYVEIRRRSIRFRLF